MEWLGQATVFSLSAYMLGCGDDAGAGGEAGGAGSGGSAGASGAAGSSGSTGGGATGGAAGSAGSGGGGVDAGSDAAVVEAGPTPACASGEVPPFQFTPTSNSVPPFDGWPVRTVDQQKVSTILSQWKLRIDGMTQSTVELSFYDLLCLARQNQVTDFHCVEGWSVQDIPWNGVHLSTLLALVQPLSSATHLTFHTINGKYNESLPMEVALEPRTLLAYGVNDTSLSLDHGFPARVVIPRLFGYKNAKFVERIELTDEPIAGYWVAKGYSYEAEVQPERLRPGKY